MSQIHYIILSVRMLNGRHGGQTKFDPEMHLICLHSRGYLEEVKCTEDLAAKG